MCSILVEVELHDVEQWRSTAAMAPVGQRQVVELLDQVTDVVRERNELRRQLHDIGELLAQVRTPWVSVRALLNELQRALDDQHRG